VIWIILGRHMGDAGNQHGGGQSSARQQAAHIESILPACIGNGVLRCPARLTSCRGSLLV
jgi:hypothetical protein